MPESSSSGFTYRAFISYSHADKAWADWLHKALETYRVPSRLVGTQSDTGAIPRRLNPVFRDRDELSSSPELGSKINAALAQAENLVVICSPAAAQSRWVNEEVLTYKRIGRGEHIFCVIVAGEPNASDLPGRAAEECFCPALRFTTDADGQPTRERTEPIAADARPGKDGKANAKLKLIAGMLGVGFDALKQREQHRKLQRMAAATSIAMVVAAMTIVLAAYAFLSRHQAVLAQHQAQVAQQAAQRRQKQAEGLVDFMLGDLNDKLAQVNRLDIMQSVDDKAMAYFQSLSNSDITSAALAGRAKALEKIATVRLNTGDLPGALTAYQASAELSSRLANAKPADIARQVAYSRILAWIGMVHWKQGKMEAAQRDFESARRVVQPSLQRAPDNLPLLEQMTFLGNDLAHVLAARGHPRAAAGLDRERLRLDERLVAAKPDSIEYAQDAGDAHNDLGRLALQRGDLAAAIDEYRVDDSIETKLSAHHPRDNDQRESMFRVRTILGRTLALGGDTSTAMLELRQSVAGLDRLARLDPRNTDVQDELALALVQLARLQRFRGDSPAARKSSARAITLLTGLTRKDASNTGWQRDLAIALTEQGAESLAVRRRGAAYQQAQQAVQLMEPLLARHPDDRQTLLAATTAELLLADASADPPTAQSLRTQALHTLQAARVNRDDPRLLALTVEAQLGLDERNQTRLALQRLQANGYRDPDFVALLHRTHVAYEPTATVAPSLRPAAVTVAGGGKPRR